MAWLHFLLLRNRVGLPAHLEFEGRTEAGEVLLQADQRPVGRRYVWRADEFCVDLDAVLWAV